jgi:(p)ppGpp synthase/HD superfamily hydrolase
LIGKITKIINDDKITMIGLNAKKLSNNKANVSINVKVKDKLELDGLINKLSQNDFVLEVYR